MRLSISDWVQGKTKEGELIFGFIETMDMLQGIVTVHVVKSDNEAIVGKIAAVRAQWLKPVANITQEEPQLVNKLIDLALATWDEAWFMELTNANKSMDSSTPSEGNHLGASDFLHNRLGTVGH